MTHQTFCSPRAGLALRLCLKPKTEPIGCVDGSWWPRSKDLSVELPRLLATLSISMGSIDRVTYRVGEWTSTSRRILFLNRLVHLGWSLLQPANTISIRGASGTHLTLLIVPPSSELHFEQNAMVAEAALGNMGTVTQPVPPDVTRLARWIDTVEAEDQWDSDGGAQLVRAAQSARRTS